MSRSRAVFAALAALLAIALIAGCGGDDESDPAAGGDNGAATENGGDAGGGVEEAQERVETLMDPTAVEFSQPEEPFQPGQGRMAVISCGNAGINCRDGSEDATEAIEAMGWQSSPVFDGEFSPATQSGFVRQAVQQGYDAIVLVSIDVQSIRAAVQAAADADIPVTCVMCSNPGLEDIVTDVTTGGTADGEAIGWWTIADSQGSADVLAYDDPSFPIVAERVRAAMQVLEENCPDCSVEESQIATTELEEPGPPTWTAALSSNPPGTIGYVWAAYDPFAIPMTRTAQQQGRDDLKITGYDASPDFVDLIRQDTPAAATTAAPFEYAAWGAVDQAARMVRDAEMWDATSLPVLLVTEENADIDALQAGFFDPPFDYKADFQELWGSA